MVSQEQKDQINAVILRCLGYNSSTLYKAPDQFKDIESFLNIKEADYEAILKKKNDVDIQLRMDLDMLSTLVALRRYSSEIEQDLVHTESDIMMDNYEDELESYMRGYM